MTELSYVDASALVKLVVEESGSDAMLRWYVESERAVGPSKFGGSCGGGSAAGRTIENASRRTASATTTNEPR